MLIRSAVLLKLFKINGRKYYVHETFLGEMQRIAFRLMLSSCVCVCVCVCLSVCRSVCVFAAFVDARKTV